MSPSGEAAAPASAPGVHFADVHWALVAVATQREDLTVSYHIVVRRQTKRRVSPACRHSSAPALLFSLLYRLRDGFDGRGTDVMQSSGLLPFRSKVRLQA
jgi:hypothetical protein